MSGLGGQYCCWVNLDYFASLLFKLSSVPLPLLIFSSFAPLARPWIQPVVWWTWVYSNLQQLFNFSFEIMKSKQLILVWIKTIFKGFFPNILWNKQNLLVKMVICVQNHWQELFYLFNSLITVGTIDQSADWSIVNCIAARGHDQSINQLFNWWRLTLGQR